MNSAVNPNRWIPQGMNGHYDCIENGNCEIFYSVTPDSRNRYSAIAFYGKCKNSSWYYAFKTEESMRSYIEKYIEERKTMEESKKTRKEEQKKRNAEVVVNVGDIFCYSWGYDQTNVDFYQVIEVKGKTATLRAIGAKQVKGSGGFMSCNLSPVKDSFKTGRFAETIKKRIQSGYSGTPSFSMPHGSLSLTREDSSHYSSWYA